MDIINDLKSNQFQTTKGKDFLKSINTMNNSHLKTQINTHVTYGKMFYPQFKLRMNEIIKLNIEEWKINIGSSFDNRDSSMTEIIEKEINSLHWLLDYEMLERIGKLRFEQKMNDFPSITLTFPNFLMCEIINDGKFLSVILFPMKCNSYNSYSPINFYQYPITGKKVSFKEFKKIVKDVGTDEFDFSENFDYHFNVMKNHKVV